jgi:hypothetical protein
MTRPLRRAHFFVWVMLGAALAVVFSAGLAARRTTTPVNPEFRWERLP